MRKSGCTEDFESMKWNPEITIDVVKQRNMGVKQMTNKKAKGRSVNTIR